MKKSTGKEINKAFKTHRVNGVFLTFPNGNTLSTIWGSGSHTENHDFGFNYMGQSLNQMMKNKANKKNDQFSNVRSIMDAFYTPIERGSNTVEVMPTCSKKVMDILKKKFPENEDEIIFNYLTFSQ